MLKIKLTRTGKKNQASFRIVVAEARSKRDGKFIENLGHYTPSTIPSKLQLDLERYSYWLSQGAIPTSTVQSLRLKTQTNNLTELPVRTRKKNRKSKETSQ